MANVFLPLDEIQEDTFKLGTRGLKKLTTSRGDYLSLTQDNKNLFIVMGTRPDPMITTTGMKENQKDGNTWHSLTVGLNRDRIMALQLLDAAVVDLLGKNSEELFGILLTSDQVRKLNYYEPLIRPSDDGAVVPFFLSKAHKDCQLVDGQSEPLPDCEDGAILPGAEVRVVIKFDCLFFKSKNSCKVRNWCMNAQLLKQGMAQNEFQFD